MNQVISVAMTRLLVRQGSLMFGGSCEVPITSELLACPAWAVLKRVEPISRADTASQFFRFFISLHNA